VEASRARASEALLAERPLPGGLRNLLRDLRSCRPSYTLAASEQRAEAAATDEEVLARHRANIEYLAPIAKRETKDAVRRLRRFQLSPSQRESMVNDPDTYIDLSLDQMKEWVTRHFAKNPTKQEAGG
jgi:hypothetical protein